MDKETPEDRAATHIYKMVSMSFQMEAERYTSLVSSVNNALLSNSVISVALATLLPFLEEKVSNKGALHLLAAAAAALLLLSFLCALVALWRFKYRALNTPVYLSEFYSDQVDEFTSNLLAVQNYARSLEEPYQSLVKRNNSISRLHKAAIVLLIIGTSIVLCSVLLTTLAPAILGVFMLA